MRPGKITHSYILPVPSPSTLLLSALAQAVAVPRLRPPLWTAQKGKDSRKAWSARRRRRPRLLWTSRRKLTETDREKEKEDAAQAEDADKEMK